jgi:hypothetical protein
MATTLSLSGGTPFYDGGAGSQLLFGIDNGYHKRVLRYTFVTPASGASKITLQGYIRHYGFSGDLSTYPILFAITESSSSHKNGGSYEGAITSTSVNVTIMKALKPNTTYYLWLFPGHSTQSLWYAYDNSGNTTLSLSVEQVKYSLDISESAGTDITVKRTSSVAGAAAGELPNGAALYYGDVLTVTLTVSAAYKLESFTLNSSAFTSGGSHTVKGDVTVKATAKILGAAYIEVDGVMTMFLVYIDTGSDWVQVVPYVDTGSDWSVCS